MTAWSPTVTDQMANYVALVAFGSTWTIMMIVAFRTQRLGPAVIFLLPVPCSVSFASILPLVWLLLVLIVLGSVIQLPLVLSLAFRRVLIFCVSSLIPSSSRIPTIPGHVAHLLVIPALYSTFPIMVTFPLSLVVSILCYLAFLLLVWLIDLRAIDSTFSGGGDDEGSAAANSVMPALADGDRGLEGIGSSVGTVGGSTGARMVSRILLRVLLILFRIGVSNVANTFLKQQYESFSVSNSEGLRKGYDKVQSLLSQLEIHGAGVSTKDTNQKFIRSLPASWSQVSLIMRTKPGVDYLLPGHKVFEYDVKGSTAFSSSIQNVAFVYSESTNSTNDVSTTYGASTSSSHNSQRENSSSYADEVMYSFFANESSGPQLDHKDLE
ncbi:hypothetical protein Tco_1335421 [Tanacetum coccineum]